MAFSMTDDELRTRIRNGTPIKILAELNGCSDASIYNWMKKNGIKSNKAPAPKPEKIMVDETVFDDLETIIDGLKRDIDDLACQIEDKQNQLDSWNRILKAVKVKGGKDDGNNQLPLPHQL